MKTSIFRQRFYLLILLSLLCFGCGEKDEKERCDFNDPLTDLLWLKEVIDIHKENAQAGYGSHARIYQCTYKAGRGFLLEMCVGCPDFGYSFRNCEGEVLCGGGGIDGKDSCSEYNIDFENKKLIWESNN